MTMITEMTQMHTAQVAALERLCFVDPWSEKSVAGELSNPLSLWLVALDGETVAGYVGSQSVPPEADMMNIAVAPEYRRCGIAAALIEQLVGRLAANGIASLTLEVRASNLPARGLYDRLGFSQVGLRKNYYRNPREDALILRKEWEA